ncbi:secretin and TonB N-terminal domain-containing protein [Chlamydiota bacterium]
MKNIKIKILMLLFLFGLQLIWSGFSLESEPVSAIIQKNRATIYLSVTEILSHTIIENLQLKNADLDTVLNLFSKQYNLNIIAGKIVRGEVTINLHHVTLQSALESILAANGFGYTIEGNIIKVLPLNIIAEDLKAKKEIEEYEELETIVVQLMYLDAKDVAEIIKSLLSPRGKISVLERTTRPGWKISGISSEETQEMFTNERQERDTTSSERSKTLIITDIPSRIIKILAIIKKVDTISRQIIIDALIIEIGSNTEKNLGIKWDSLKAFTVTGGPANATTPLWKVGTERTRTLTDSDKNTLTRGEDQTHTFNLGTEHENKSLFDNIATTPIDGISRMSLNTDKYTGKIDYTKTFKNTIDQDLANIDKLTDVRTAILTTDQFEVILSALNELDDFEVISNPTIMTIDNHEATILVGEKFPIFKTDVSDQGTVTESFDRFEPVGISLRVIPQISEGDRINMVVHPTVSAIGDFVTGTTGLTYPRIKIREADTQVLVNRGNTVVIGGLVSNNESIVTTKIPLLGDLPFLGFLFRHKNTVKDRVNMLVFVTPTIVDNEALSKHEKILHQYLQKKTTLDPYIEKINKINKKHPRKKRFRKKKTK